MSSTETLCVFTPTYNRAYCIADLYHSLTKQTCKDFNWLIVDDGSTDQTEQLVEDLSEKSPFRITYIKQQNGGKQRAFNTGVANCNSELFMCVDSDDTVPADMVETVLLRWDEVKGNPSVGGVIGMCGKNAHEPLKTSIPDALDYVTMWDLYYKYKHKGDTALAHRTDILREFPFEVDPHEKFIAETFVFHQIDQIYTLGVIHKVLIEAHYRKDGYTANVRKVTRENPIGYAKLKRMYIEYADTLPLKYYESILYLVGCHFAKRPKAIRSAPNPGIAACAWLPAKILCHTVYRAR